MCRYRSSCCEMEHICYQEIFSPHGDSGAFKLTDHVIQTSPSVCYWALSPLPLCVYICVTGKLWAVKNVFLFFNSSSDFFQIFLKLFFHNWFNRIFNNFFFIFVGHLSIERFGWSSLGIYLLFSVIVVTIFSAVISYRGPSINDVTHLGGRGDLPKCYVTP